MDENKTPQTPASDAEDALSLDLTASRRSRRVVPADMPTVAQEPMSAEEVEAPAQAEEVPAEEAPATVAPVAPQVPPAPPKKKKKKKKKSSGCLKGAIYAVLVLLFALTLALFALLVAVDAFGVGKPDTEIDVIIEEGWYGEEIANALEQSDIIDYPILFRLYCRFFAKDAVLHPGEFTLRPNMGYADIVEALQAQKQRETVNVTIPEGYTVDKIAALLEKKNVCTRADFYAELGNWRNYDQYDFIQELLAAEAADPHCFDTRVYVLEGYLFPDTYNFFVDCSAASVVRKLLDNFDTRLTTSLRSTLKAQGWSVDQAVILSSIIQREADANIMGKVARVLLNRLNNTAQYPKLECCSTRDYIRALLPSEDGQEAIRLAYDTYQRKGLPVGAICNPGLAAIGALASPSQDPQVENCYFFATDYDTQITYFSKTYKQHEAVCRKYKIGMYG